MLSKLVSDGEVVGRGLEQIYAGIKLATDGCMAHESATDKGVQRLRALLVEMRDKADQLTGLLVHLQLGTPSHWGLTGRAAMSEVEDGSF